MLRHPLNLVHTTTYVGLKPSGLSEVDTEMVEIISGDEAAEKVGLRMSTEQVQRMNELRQASRVRALSSQEEFELSRLEARNRTRTRFE